MSFCATVPSGVSVPGKRSGGGLGVVAYKYYNSRRRSGGGRGGRVVESGTICACAYWTLPPPPDRSPGTGSDLARSFPLPALYLPIFLTSTKCAIERHCGIPSRGSG